MHEKWQLAHEKLGDMSKRRRRMSRLTHQYLEAASVQSQMRTLSGCASGRKSRKEGSYRKVADATFACKAPRHVTSRSTMPQDQPQTISVTDLDIAQLADVKKQLEEVRSMRME